MRSWSLLFILLGIIPRIFAGSTVTNCNEADLDAALASGGTITFDCDGVIRFSGTKRIEQDTTLDASGHKVRISGDSTIQLFDVTSGVRFIVKNLALTEGFSQGGGGAIYNRGQLELENCAVVSNKVVATLTTDGQPPAGASAYGGGIFNDHGHLSANNCMFEYNSCTGGDGFHGTPQLSDGTRGGSANGGAVCSLGSGSSAFGSALTNCTFIFNTVRGGRGGDGAKPTAFFGVGGAGGSGGGAAIYHEGGIVVVSCTVASNSAFGGDGGRGAASFGWPVQDGAPGNAGGALRGIGGGTLIRNSTIAGNSASPASYRRTAFTAVTISHVVPLVWLIPS